KVTTSFGAALIPMGQGGALAPQVCWLASVAAAILAAVEGAILPPGTAHLNAEPTATPARRRQQDAGLYGGRDKPLHLAHPCSRNEPHSDRQREREPSVTPCPDHRTTIRDGCVLALLSPLGAGRGSR